MITSRKDAKEKIAEYEKIFAPIFGKPCSLTWGTFSFETTVLNIALANTTGRKNLPDKRDLDGKNKSPMLFAVNTDSGELVFTLDDAIVTAIYNGVRIIIPLDNPVGEADKIELDLRLL